MKQLEIQLKKRLLIVELPKNFTYNTYADKMSICNDINKPIHFIDDKWQLICEGSELTEEILKGLVHQSIHTDLFAHYFKDIPVNTYCYKSALEYFISAIESNGFYWGYFPSEKISWTEIQNWQEAESKTFNPEKTLIFEILL